MNEVLPKSQWRQFQFGKVRHWIVGWPSFDTNLHVYVALCGKTARWLLYLTSTERYCAECERRQKAAGRKSDK